ncbi:MAG: hypothetical protein ABIZ04_19500 [Opitutus sp.]
MPPETLKSLAYLKAKVQALEGKLTLDQAKTLVALPAQLGYASTEEFLAAFREAIGAQRTTTAGSETEGTSFSDKPLVRAATDNEEPSRSEESVVADSGADGSDSNVAVASMETSVADEADQPPHTDQPLTPSKRRTRKPVSQEVQNEVKKLVEAGKTQTAIAQELGLTSGQVKAARKALGLVGKRSGVSRKNETGSSPTKSPRRKSRSH